MHLSLDRSLVRGIAWTGVSRWSAQVISWAILLYAARVLTPDDFGVVAMAMVPIGLARLIEDLGLDAAIVQNATLTRDQISSLGGLALLTGIILAATYVFAADVIASFYGEARVAGVIRALSLVFVLDAAQIVPRALLQRELRFGHLAIVNGVQIVLAAFVLGACAYFDLSYWSLVLNHIISSALIVVLLTILIPHPLRWPTDWARLAHSIRFGGNMLLARIAWYGYSNADQALLGRGAGPDALGAYNFSMTFARIPVDEVGSLSGKVVPGIFSAVQRSPLKLSRYVLVLTEAISYLTVPATIGIALVADDFIPVAIGNQWSASILPLKALAIYACMVSVTTLWSHVLIWTGNSRINMLLNVFSLIVLVPAFYAGSKYGPLGVSLALTLVYPVTLAVTFRFVRRVISLPFGKVLLCLGPAIVSTAVMSLVVVLVRDGVAHTWPTELRFGVSVAAGVATYTAVMAMLFRGRVRRIFRVVMRSV